MSTCIHWCGEKPNVSQGVSFVLSVFMTTLSFLNELPNWILDENHFIDNGSGIYEAYLPFKSLTGHDEFRWDDLKEIRFKIMDGTQFEIGDFQIIEFRGNPKKPTKWKRI